MPPKPLRFIIKRHARRPFLELQVSDSDGNPYDFTGASSVVFSMKSEESLLVIDQKIAEFVDGDLTLGKLRYKWEATDTTVAGDYCGEFDVIYPASENLTLPIDGDIRIKIHEDVNDA